MPSANNKFSQPTTQEDISYKLSQFEIVEKKEGHLFWKSYSGRETITVGKGYVNGNILFFARGEAEKTTIMKKDFMERLSILPVWWKTNHFCQHYTLYSCVTNTICYEVDENILSNRSGNGAVVFRKKIPPDRIKYKTNNADCNFCSKQIKSLLLVLLYNGFVYFEGFVLVH